MHIIFLYFQPTDLDCIFFFVIFRAIELANGLETSDPVAIPQLEHSSEFLLEFSVYWMAKSLFDLREYRRAAHTLRQCKSDEAFFLRYYSLYLVSGTEWPMLDNSCPYCRNMFLHVVAFKFLFFIVILCLGVIVFIINIMWPALRKGTLGYFCQYWVFSMDV